MSCSPSMHCLIFLMFGPLWAVVPSDGASEVQSLTGSFGETLTLNTPDTQLIGEYEIIWSHVQGGTRTVLIHYDAGEWEKNATDKHQLNGTTGSLIIQSLTANDSGLYERKLIKGRELIKKGFNVTVVGPSSYSATPTTPAQTSADHSTAGPKPTTPPKDWTPWIVGVSCVLIVFAVLLFAVWKYRGRIKAQCEQWFRVWYTECDREDPERSSRQENVTQYTAVQATAV